MCFSSAPNGFNTRCCVFPHCEVLEAQNRDDPSQESNNHGAERRQHHFTGCSGSYSTGQSRVLDVDLR